MTTGVTYRYAVAAYRAAGGDWSNAVTATARTPTAPGAPGSLEGQATAAKVVLTWAVPGSDGGSALTAYTLYRGTGNACTGLSVLRSGLSTTGTTYTDSSVTGGTTYCYQVSASNSAGEGAKSGSTVVTAVTVGAPTGLTVTAEGDSSISLAWTAPADDGGGAIEGYNVYRCDESSSSDCSVFPWLAWVAVPGNTEYTDTTVAAGTTYRYAVAASRAAGGDRSNAVTATARTPTAPTAPTAPGSLKGQAAADRVRLVWVAPGDDGGSALTGYDVYRGTGNTCTGLDVIRNVLDAGVSTGEYIDSNVVEGETYCYRVSASNSAGEGTQSGAAVVTAVTVGAPGGLRVSAASGAAISLSWTAPADDGGGVLNSYGYGVYRCVEGTSTCVLDKPTDPLPDESSDLLAWVTSETTTFTDDQVTEGKTYRYGVIASRAGKHSSWSNIVTQTAQAPPVALPKPPTPTGLTITSASDTSISLSWAAPTDDGNGAIEGYNVYRCDESSSSDCSVFPWLAGVAVPGNTEYTDTTVAAGTTYRYAVAAYRYDGTSAEPNSASDWSDVVTQTAQAPPGAPGSLEGQATAAKVVLTWAVPGSDGGSALTAYTLYRGTGNACTGLSVLRSGLSTTGTTYTDNSVTGGTTYCYQVSASNSAGEGAKSGSAVVTAVAVGAPTGLTVTAEGDSSISLAWTAPADDDGGAIEGYNVYRCDESSSSDCSVFPWLAWVAVPGNTEYTDTTVAAGTTYRYAVAAYRAAGGDWSNAVTATARTPTAPGAPGSLEGQATAAKVVLTWAVPGSDGGSALTAYTLYRGTGNACTGLSVLRSGLSTTGTTYTDNSVTGGTTYCYQVSASNSAGEGAKSGSAVVTAVAVGAPTGLTVTAEGDSSISLAWTAPADDDGGAIEGYNVYRCDESSSSDCSVFPWLAWVAVPGNTEYTDTTVATGTTYRYAVAAYRAAGGDWSNAVTATARTPTAPGAPGSLEGQATAAKVVLTWAVPGSDGGSALTAYTLYRGTGNACTGLSVLRSGLSTTGTTYTDNSVTGGTTYCYQVSASNSAGEGMKSGSTVVTAVTVGAPTGLTVTAEGDSSISLAWTAPADDSGGAIEGYNVYRCDESSSSDCSVFPWLAWVAVPGNTEYTDTTVAAGTTYRYAVAASRAVVGDWSNAVTATAQSETEPEPEPEPEPETPPAPTGLTVTKTSAESVSLSWTAPVDDGGGPVEAYNVYRCEEPCKLTAENWIAWVDDGTEFTDTHDDSTAHEKGGNSPVVAGTTYHYAVAAYRSGNGGWAYVTATTGTPRAPKETGPAVPVGLKVTAVSAESVSLHWKPSPSSGDGAAYSVYRCTVPEGEGKSTCEPYDDLWLAYLENTNAYTDTEVTPGETYRYQVAVHPFGRDNLSKAVTVVAQMSQMVSAPTGLMVTEVDEASVRLRWTAPEDDGRGPIQAYDIYRCNVDRSPDCSEFLHLVSRNPALTDYRDNDAEPGTTYRYAVAAYRSADDVSPWSNQVTVTTQRGRYASPTDLTVTATSRIAISLSWTAPAEGILGYNVYRCSVSTGETSCEPMWHAWVANAGDTPPAPTSYTDTGGETGSVTAGATYRYMVAASYPPNYRNGDRSEAVTATAKGQPVPEPEQPKVPAPTGLTVTATSETAISLSWTAPADDGGGPIEAYNVYRCEESCELTADNWIAWVDDGTAFTDTHDDSTAHEAGGESPVVAGTTYRYTVAAYRGGDSDWSNEVTALAQSETEPETPPAPTGLTVTATSETAISLSWTAPADDGGGPIEAYNVYRCEESCELTADNWIAWVDDGTAFTDTHDDSTAHEAGGESPVVAGTTYRYTVAAYRGGDSDWSNEVTALAQSETEPETPPAPTGLTVTATSETAISLSWTAPADDGGGPIEAYNVYRCEESCELTADNWIAWVDDGTAFTDTHDDSTAHEAGGESPVVAGTTYRYTVAAYRGGDSDWSNEVTALAQSETEPETPPAPTGLTVTATSETAISLSYGGRRRRMTAVARLRPTTSIVVRSLVS